MTFFELLTPIVRRWRLVAVCGFGSAAVAAAISLVVPKVWTASTSFTPEAPNAQALAGGLGGLAGLAGQLGLATGPGSVSPEFFATVLESREILEAVLRDSFPDPTGGRPRPLLDLMRIRGRDDGERLMVGVRELRKLVSTAVDARTGIVNVGVRQRDPDLAAAVANRLTALLNRFNLERRQSQSREQARFATQRLDEAARELRVAEDALLRFLQSNRTYRGSALLEAEFARLERVVQLKQEVHTNLAKAREDARIAEVRDTPVLTTIDRAVPPRRRTAPHRKLYVLVGGTLGGIFGVLLAYLADLRHRSGLATRADVREFSAALTQARGDLTRWVRRGP